MRADFRMKFYVTVKQENISFSATFVEIYLKVTNLLGTIFYIADCLYATLAAAFAFGFYSASALLAMQSAVLARDSVCLSVHHVPVLCPDE